MVFQPAAFGAGLTVALLSGARTSYIQTLPWLALAPTVSHGSATKIRSPSRATVYPKLP